MSVESGNKPIDRFSLKESSDQIEFISSLPISGRQSEVNHQSASFSPTGFTDPVLLQTSKPSQPRLIRTSQDGNTPQDGLADASTIDPILNAYEEIRAKIYTEAPVEQPENTDPGGYDYSNEDAADGGLPKATPSKPDESALDDLSAYIQNQLKGKDNTSGDRKAARQQLVPIPLRCRRPPKARSREELEPLRKREKPTEPALFDFTFPDENPFKDGVLRREFMGRGTHLPPLPELKHSVVRLQPEPGAEKRGGHFQRIFPEDPNWKLTMVDRLSEICLQTIFDHFQDMPYQIAALPIEMQERFLPKIPVASEANLYLAVDYFHSEKYWERSCRARWGKSVFPHAHGSWKLTYIERGFQELIENYVPLQSDPNILLNDLLNIGEYVLTLKVSQLLPPVRHTFGDFASMIEAQLANQVQFTEPYEKSLAESNQEPSVRDSTIIKAVPLAGPVKKYLDPTGSLEREREFPAVNTMPWTDKAKVKFQRLVTRELDLNRGTDEGDRLLMNVTRELDDTPAHPRTMNPFLAADHMNLVPVIANMPHLMDLELRYGVKECGMNFSWRLFQFTLNDAKRLSEALVITASLRRLCLVGCRIDDVKGVIVLEALVDHPNLAILELQCNELGEQSAAVVGRMIKLSEVLNKVDLSENLLGDTGAKVLAKSLVRGVSLRILNLRMNKISDVGAEALFLVTKSCITFLQQINLSANQITGKIVDLLTESMKVNKKLEKYDLSVNELEGVAESRKLQDALAQSYHIQEFWLQENKFPVDFEASMEELLARNQDFRLEQILLDIESNYDFDIKKIKFPSEDALKSSSDDDSSISGSFDDDGDGSCVPQHNGSQSSTDNEVDGTAKVTSRK